MFVFFDDYIGRFKFSLFASDTLISLADLDSFSIDDALWEGRVILSHNRLLNA